MATHYFDSVTASSNLIYYFPFNNSDFASAGSASVVEGVNLFTSSANYAFTLPSQPSNHGPDDNPTLELNGGGEAFYISASASIFNDRSFTVSGWFRAGTAADKGTILNITGGTHSELCINISNTGVLTAELTDDSNNKISVTADSYDTSDAVDNDLWHHFNVSSDASNLKISLNGGPFNTVAHSGGSLVLDYQDVYIGAHTDSTKPFDGEISHIAIFDTENASRELYLAGAETYSYEYITKTWMTRYQFSATGDSSNTHPVEGLYSQTTASSNGIFFVETGGPSASAYIGSSGFFFDRSGVEQLNTPLDGDGISAINQDVTLFDNTNGWIYHTWFKSASVNSAAGGPALARNPGNYGSGQMIIRVNGSGAGSPGNAGKIQAYIGGKNLYSTASTYHDGNWHHVAWGAAGGTLRLWVDGTAVASTAVGGSVVGETTKPLMIGRGDHSAPGTIDERWYGWIDESHFIQPPAGITATQATTSVPDFYRMGLYQHSITPATNASITSDPFITASASFPDSTISVTSNAEPAIDPFAASALFVDPTFTTFKSVSYDADPFVVSEATLLGATWSTDVLEDASPLTAEALMTSASVDVQTVVDVTAWTASASMGSGTGGAQRNIQVRSHGLDVLSLGPEIYIPFHNIANDEDAYDDWVEPLTPVLNLGQDASAVIDETVTASGPGLLYKTGILWGTSTLTTTFGRGFDIIPSASAENWTLDFFYSNTYNNPGGGPQVPGYVLDISQNPALSTDKVSGTLFTIQGRDLDIRYENTGVLFVGSASYSTLSPPDPIDWDYRDWWHFTLIKSGSVINWYLNETLVKTIDISTNSASISGQEIKFRNVDDPDDTGVTSIDEIVWFDRAVNINEITNTLSINPYTEPSYVLLIEGQNVIEPTTDLGTGPTINGTALTASATMGDHRYGNVEFDANAMSASATFPDGIIRINEITAEDFYASASFVEPAFITQTLILPDAMSASAILPLLIQVQGEYTWVQENTYIAKLKEIGAEIGIAKAIFTDDEWVDYNKETSSSANFIFGLYNSYDGMGGSSAAPDVPATTSELTCNNSKWGGIFTGSEFMNFYPIYDQYGIGADEPTVGELSGAEDWHYNEFTGPWFYATNEDSYELVFRTTTENQILLSGQTTYVVEGENNTETLEDNTRINTYIEYGLVEGKLYVKFYPTLDATPIEIVGNTNIADGEDHHIVLQRTSASGLYRSNYVLNMDIGNTNQWSLESGVKHAVVGQQTVEDVYYEDPYTGEVFHGFEIWIDGELDTRSASFNSTHLAPIVKSLGGRTYIYVTQDGVGQAVYNRATTSGIEGTLTSFFARFNTENIDALSSYNIDFADMPRFPQEAKILRHAAVDPPTIKILSQLALTDGSVSYVTTSTASASMVDPVVTTNVGKILRLYWTGPETVGTNFGTSHNGQDFVVDTYSVLYELSNNPSHVYNVDAAQRDGVSDPTAVAVPTIIDRWKDDEGNNRLLNINTDLDLSEYSTIIFMDYPDNSDEIDAILPSNNYVYIQSQMDAFIDRLKTAVIDGKALYVSSPTLAVRLGIISKETVVTQTYDATDIVSASINPFITTASVYFDTHRNNRYEIVKQIAGVTDIPGFIMTDAISYNRNLNDEYHIKYANRSNGLQVGDELIIPGLPLIPSQLNSDYAGYTNNRITNLHVIESDDVLSGDVIAKLAGTNYVTTLVLKPGDLLGSDRIDGRVFVNFVEDALTLGLEQYNYGTIQTGITSRSTDENSETVEWNYSTSRTTRKLAAETNIITTKGKNGQTAPTYGGGGPIVQAPTSSTYGNIRIDHDADNEAFVSSIYFDQSSEKYPTDIIYVPSMTIRGLEWLTGYSYSNRTNVGVDVITSTAEMVQPTLPETSVLNGSTSVSVDPMNATALMKQNPDAMWINQNSIILVLTQNGTINLQIQKEVTK